MMVWRVQTEDGRGPYQPPTSSRWRSSTPTSHGCPLPYSDGMDGWSMEHIFGFASRQQLLEWFPPQDHDSLGSAGLHEAIYEVPEEHVVRGGVQLCFRALAARLVRQERMRSTGSERLPPAPDWIAEYTSQLVRDVPAVAYTGKDKDDYVAFRKRSDNRCTERYTRSSAYDMAQRRYLGADWSTTEDRMLTMVQQRPSDQIFSFYDCSPTGSRSPTMSEDAFRAAAVYWLDDVVPSLPAAPTARLPRSSGTVSSASAQPSLDGAPPDSAGE